MGKIENLVGQRFNRLIVLNFNRREAHFTKEGNHKYYRYFWDCKCDCGNNCVVQGLKLKSGHTQSCGCYKRDKTSEGRFIHGKSRTYMYRVYVAIRQRCYNSNSPDYKDYGGRGIIVCDRWQGKDGLKNFAEDMGERPSPNYSLDRINVNGNYCPENCRWATSLEQANNQRRNIILEMNGEEKTLTNWARDKGINHGTLRSRVSSGKWSIEEALTEPVIGHKTYTDQSGEAKTLTEWSNSSGVKRETLRSRVEGLGWSIDRAISEPLNTKFSHKKKDPL